MRVEGLSFSYKNKEILKNISFAVNEGEILTILGVNGAGKSTTMKCLAGILKTDAKIDLCGASVKEIGYLTQNIMQEGGLSVFELVLLGRISKLNFKVSRSDLQRVEHVLKHVGIEHLAKRSFSELSGGQQRLVLIAMVFAKTPKIMLLDEPTANLDLLHQKDILNLIRDYTKFYKISTVINIHDINHALNYGDKIMVLHNGEIAFLGAPKDLDTALLSEVFGVEFEFLQNRSGKKFIANF